MEGLTFDQAREEANQFMKEVMEALLVASESRGAQRDGLAMAERILRQELYPLIRKYRLIERTSGDEKTLFSLMSLVYSEFEYESGGLEKRTRELIELIHKHEEPVVTRTELPQVIELREAIEPGEELVVTRRKLVEEKKGKGERVKVSREGEEAERKGEVPAVAFEKKRQKGWGEQKREKMAAEREVTSAHELMLRTIEAYENAHEKAVSEGKTGEVAETALVLAKIPDVPPKERDAYAEIAATMYEKLWTGEKNPERQRELMSKVAEARTILGELRPHLTKEEICEAQERALSPKYRQFR